MNEIRRVCVYCGSSAGFDPAYKKAATELGALLATEGIGLVYGGGKVGLMGALADAMLAAGGEVIGIIPHHLLALEVGHRELTSLIAVDTMHARKHQMAEMADAFLALPGGIGTAEELLEVLTWLQLGLHAKPVGVLNTLDYYGPLLRFLEQMCATGFLKAAHRDMLLVAESGADLLAQCRNFTPRQIDKRITAIE
jgi:uncharacterized protein (TIGR00730 family)